MMTVVRSLCCLLMVVVWTQQPACAEEVSGGNAALKYWQAFSVMPEVTTEVFQNAIKQPPDDRLDRETVDLIGRSTHALMLLQRGADQSFCDWGLNLSEDGAEALLPHLVRARTLSRLALLRARHRFQQNHDSAALKDTLAAMALARHAGRDRTLVGLLVNYSIEQSAQDVVSAYLPALSPEARREFESGLAKLPAENSIAHCMVTEGYFVDWLIGRVGRTGTNAELLAFCRDIMGIDEKKADEFIKSCGGRQGIIQHAGNMKPLYAALPRLVIRSGTDLDQRRAMLLDQALQNPVGKYLFPALDKSWHADSKHRCRTALLVAALDIAEQGPVAINNHKDPADNTSPFEIVDLKQGYELRSKLKNTPTAESVVRLVVGSFQQD